MLSLMSFSLQGVLISNPKLPLPPLDLDRYVLPGSFGLTIDDKLRNNTQLNQNQIHEMVRVLCNSFLQFTHAPTADQLRVVVSRLFQKFDCLIFRDLRNVKDEIASQVSLSFFRLSKMLNFSSYFYVTEIPS